MRRTARDAKEVRAGSGRGALSGAARCSETRQYGLFRPFFSVWKRGKSQDFHALNRVFVIIRSPSSSLATVSRSTRTARRTGDCGSGETRTGQDGHTSHDQRHPRKTAIVKRTPTGKWFVNITVELSEKVLPGKALCPLQRKRLASMSV